MAGIFSHRRRPVHAGPYPAERLARLDSPAPIDLATLPRLGGRTAGLAPDAVAHAIERYFALFRDTRDGFVAPAPAPVPDALEERANNLKAAAYFLDASLVGTCAIPAEAWTADPPLPHDHAIVIAVEFGRGPAPGGPGEAWIRGTQPERAHLRAAEVAVCIAGYVRNLGYPARAHVAGASEVDVEMPLVWAGLARVERGAGLSTPTWAIGSAPPS